MSKKFNYYRDRNRMRKSILPKIVNGKLSNRSEDRWKSWNY